jgi:hypothetical protein
MKTVSHRVRTAVIALFAALAMAITPAVAANAEGPGSATITFTGAQLPPFEYVWYEGPDGEINSAPVDSDGVLVLTDLALGEYSASVSGTATTQQASFSFTLTAEQPHYEGEVELQPWPTGTASIEGVVTGSGEPLEGVQLFLTAFSGQSYPDFFTGPDGAFAFTDLPAGDYELYAFGDGYFEQNIPLLLTDGEAVNLDIALIPHDAAITGRVVDSDGAGVEGVVVAATRDTYGSSAETDADGYYTILYLGEGEWTVSLGGSDSPWEYTSTVVWVDAASTAPAPDLVAVLRTTGTINGLVVGADQPPEISGLGDVCVNVVTLDGADVPGATGLTESAGNYYVDDVPPGEYSVRFTDCDPTRDPQYQAAYLGDTTDLAEATTFTVNVADNLWVGFVHLTPVGAQPEPEAAPVPVRSRDLVAEDEGAIGALGDLFEGQQLPVQVGIEYAGQWVSVWLRTPTTDLGGWHLVADDGSVMVLVPDSFPPTYHRLVVQDADDAVIGWTTVRVAKPGRGQGEP